MGGRADILGTGGWPALSCSSSGGEEERNEVKVICWTEFGSTAGDTSRVFEMNFVF